MRVYLANPRGFCAGVSRAIDIVERTLEEHGAPVYVRHEIVHNARVVNRLRGSGVEFVQDVAAIPRGAVAVFSAHGVARSVATEAARRGLDVVDATCPLVAKVHRAARRHVELGRELVVIGHAGHPEVIGTLGQVDSPAHVVASLTDVERLHPRDPSRLAYVTQTTLSVADTREIVQALEMRFPGIAGAATRDICYATHNRQQAVRELAARSEFVIVVGAAHSSNSRRLQEIAAGAARGAVLVPDADALRREWLAGIATLGITAGASAPEELVREVLDRLREWHELEVVELPGPAEEVELPMPPRYAVRARREGLGA